MSGDPALKAWQREFVARLAEGARKPEASFAPRVKPSGSTLATTDGSWVDLLKLQRCAHTAIYDPGRTAW